MATTPLSKNQDVLYSDLRMDMLLNPVNSDVSRATDEEAIRISLRNILLTNKGERLFNPTFGGSINELLFDNIGLGSKEIIQTNIETVIRNYEPRIILIKTDVSLSPDLNSATITVTFMMINKQEPVTLSVILDRAR
jgi:phage baseplate assembly protein W